MFKKNKILSKALFGLGGFIYISTFFRPAQSQLQGQLNSNEVRLNIFNMLGVDVVH